MKVEWTRYETNRLRILYGLISVPEICKVLDRTPPSVRAKARLMGLEQDQVNMRGGQVYPSSQLTDAQLDMICSLLDDSWTLRQIFTELFNEVPGVNYVSLKDRVQSYRGTQIAGEVA